MQVRIGVHPPSPVGALLERADRFPGRPRTLTGLLQPNLDDTELVSRFALDAAVHSVQRSTAVRTGEHQPATLIRIRRHWIPSRRINLRPSVSTAGLRLPESPAPTHTGAYVWWLGLLTWRGIPRLPVRRKPFSGPSSTRPHIGIMPVIWRGLRRGSRRCQDAPVLAGVQAGARG